MSTEAAPSSLLNVVAGFVEDALVVLGQEQERSRRVRERTRALESAWAKVTRDIARLDRGGRAPSPLEKTPDFRSTAEAQAWMDAVEAERSSAQAWVDQIPEVLALQRTPESPTFRGAPVALPPAMRRRLEALQSDSRAATMSGDPSAMEVASRALRAELQEVEGAVSSLNGISGSPGILQLPRLETLISESAKKPVLPEVAQWVNQANQAVRGLSVGFADWDARAALVHYHSVEQALGQVAVLRKQAQTRCEELVRKVGLLNADRSSERAAHVEATAELASFARMRLTASLGLKPAGALAILFSIVGCIGAGSWGSMVGLIAALILWPVIGTLRAEPTLRKHAATAERAAMKIKSLDQEFAAIESELAMIKDMLSWFGI
jgi:hypothetical protein